ncbi:MAG: DNA cytosine methyltransferase [Anaerolineaceae bacterium]
MKPTLIDLYSGCGGVTQGFKNAGFNVVAAVEWEKDIASSYTLNHPEVAMYDKDIRNLQPKEVMKKTKLHRNELTVLSICAPCQPFSRQNHSKKDDNRTKLILEAIRFVAVFRPKYIIMENVPGLNKGENKLVLDKFIEIVKNEFGYVFNEPKIVNAVDYGVPQFRKRLILLGTRENLSIQFPEISHVSPKILNQDNKKVWSTVGDAFKGITRLSSGCASRSDPLHKARKHTQINLTRLKFIPKNGGSRKSLPENLQLKCHKNGTGFNDVYGRLDFSRPANTLTTGCTNITKGRYAHPTANRAITPREAARLQTFPDTYKFSGSYDQISSQIGNAVPVKLAEVFADNFVFFDNNMN